MNPLDEFDKYRQDPLYMVYKLWGLSPQPPKPEYVEKWYQVANSKHEEWEAMKEEVCAEWFGDKNPETGRWEWYDFQKGKHITWQQTLVLWGLRKASNGFGKRMISVVSGHGTGKSTSISWILIWFLLVHQDSQIAATAPTAYQMHDVLWKEASIWLGKIKDPDIKSMFEWQSGYIRIKQNAEAWFARAKTATKENTEALAGVHADDVMLLIDESSGVHEAVFNTAEGALTSGNVFMVMISNGTRTSGYFYDSHHKNKEDWQCFAFDGEESPMVDYKYIERQEKRHGRGSDEFTIRVSGGFPRSDAMDDSGYYQLTPLARIEVMSPPPSLDQIYWFGRRVMGIDPAGEGKDKASFVIKDRFKCVCVGELGSSNSKQIANKALEYIKQYNIKSGDVAIDAFGVGHDVAFEIMKSSKSVLGYEFECYPLLVGKKPQDEEKLNGHLFKRRDCEMYEKKDTKELSDLYLNLRALLHARASRWILSGGVIYDYNVVNSKFKEQLGQVKAKRGMQTNMIQLMSKKEMQKLRIPSPNMADALSLCEVFDLEEEIDLMRNAQEDENMGETGIDDKYSVL